MIMKLGRNPRRYDPRNLRMARYTTAELPPPPDSVDWTQDVSDIGMLLNDVEGDCTCAGAGHMIQEWTAYAGNECVPTDDQIQAVYEAVGGYVPGDPTTDNGCNMQDVLNYWRNTGIAGHKIAAYVSVDYTNLTEVKQAIALFGNVYLGVNLPVSVQGAASWELPEPDDPNGVPGSWGGHCITSPKYDADKITVWTWGKALDMSWDFLLKYGEEAWAVLSNDWTESSGLAPSQFDLATLQSDLTLVQSMSSVKK
jgi:hypothetical protein